MRLTGFIDFIEGPPANSGSAALFGASGGDVQVSMGPGGPIANIAGLKIEDSQGNLLHWLRTPGEVYRLEVEVPAGVDGIRVFLHYIADQPTTTSYGHDCFSGSSIGVISPGAVLLYPEATDIDLQQITTRL